MNKLMPDSFYERNLPHFQPPGATFFITYRLAGSLPAAVVADLGIEVQQLQAELERERESPKRSERMYRAQRLYFGKWDAALDAGTSPNWLSHPDVASLVAEAMHHFDGARYDLLVYCIMPNHVHVVLTPLLKTADRYYPLAQIMHTMKGYTAGRANLVLGNTGVFWQHESYDHCVRDEEELRRIIGYVLNNPVRAGLIDKWEAWPWTYVAQACDPRSSGL